MKKTFATLATLTVLSACAQPMGNDPMVGSEMRSLAEMRLQYPTLSAPAFSTFDTNDDGLLSQEEAARIDLNEDDETALSVSVGQSCCDLWRGGHVPSCRFRSRPDLAMDQACVSLPRASAATPVRATSCRPSGRIRSAKASIFSGVPVISNTKVSSVLSTTLALKISASRSASTRWSP